jgi:transposase
VLAALDHRGIRAALLIEGATDGEVFRHFVQRVLLPALRLGDIVVWDNLSAHKVAGAAEVLATVGATQHYLPPYSPDYNPIEKAWSKIKTQLRAAGARTRCAETGLVADYEARCSSLVCTLRLSLTLN